MDSKICTGCGLPKSLEAFHADARGKWGRRAKCVACENEQEALRRKKSRGEIRPDGEIVVMGVPIAAWLVNLNKLVREA